MTVGSQIAGAAQARDRHRIERVVVGLAIEQAARRVERAGPSRQPGNVEFGIGGAIDMASTAADAGLPRYTAEDSWRTERQIAQIHQIRLGAADRLRSEDLARL